MAGEGNGALSDSASESTGRLLRRCQQRASDILNRAVAPVGLTPRQFTVLETVAENEGVSQTELVELTGIDRSTLADIISRLMRRDLVVARRTEADQRANAVRMTPEGRRALREAQPRVAGAEAEILAPISPADRADFIAMLRALADADGENAAISERRAAPRLDAN